MALYITILCALPILNADSLYLTLDTEGHILTCLFEPGQTRDIGVYIAQQQLRH